MKNIDNKEIKPNGTSGLISASERETAEFCIEEILRQGAQQARISLSKSVVDSYGTLDGELDKVSHSADQSLFMYIYAEGKYGTFSTNMPDRKALENFIRRAVSTVRLLEEDPYRCLPEPSRTAKDAVTGREMGLWDENYELMTADRRRSMALSECIVPRKTVLSEECEYSDSVEDNYIIDSQGFAGRHTESSFAVCSEITIADRRGRKFSGYMWDSSPFLEGLSLGTCSEKALQRAESQLNPKKHKGGRLTAVVDTLVSSRIVSPIFSALNAMSIQQKSSFLEDSLGKKIFSEHLNIMDFARTPGRPGSRLFDSEGVATSERPVIEEGVVSKYFVNTYMSRKTGLAPTVESVSRPVLLPYGRTSELCDAFSLMKLCGEGIYITGFNGGNCNPVTGDFSYGVEGFAFSQGQITHPVREMLITGNMISLWNSLIAAGNDPRTCTRWQIPSLAFENVDFSG